MSSLSPSAHNHQTQQLLHPSPSVATPRRGASSPSRRLATAVLPAATVAAATSPRSPPRRLAHRDVAAMFAVAMPRRRDARPRMGRGRGRAHLPSIRLATAAIPATTLVAATSSRSRSRHLAHRDVAAFKQRLF